MGIKRIVDTTFWTDDKVMDKFSPEDKLFMLYLMTNPHTTQLGVYQINIKYMALELGYSHDTIRVLLDRFQNKYKIILYSNETNEIAVKNYLKYSIVKGGKPVEDCLKKEIKQVKNKSLLKFIYNNIKGYDNLNETVKIILEMLNVNEKEKENDNENENEESWYDSPNDSSNDSVTTQKITKKKKVKHKYGEYKNVLLADDEIEKLKNEYGVEIANDCLTYLDEYIEMKGYKAKSHYLAIRKWVIEAVQEKYSKNSKSKINQKQSITPRAF